MISTWKTRMATPQSTPTAAQTVPGRGLFWFGIALFLLGLVLPIGQMAMKILGVPWYSPALASVGAILLLIALLKRQSIARIAVFFLVAAFAGFQWYLLASVMRLPEYEGPAQAGKKLPAFSAVFANGKPFTEETLADGTKRALVFFRGRW